MQMKKLVFAALLCGGIAQLGTGCIITSSDPDEPIYYDGTISASWTLVSGDANVQVGCPDGATTIEVVTENVDTGNQIVDQFDCVDGGGVIERAPGTYDIWTRLTDDTALLTYAQSTLVTVSVEAGVDTPADFTFSIDRGSFYLTWDITDAGNPAGCDIADIGDVSVTSTVVGDPGTFYDDVTPCAQYEFTTPGLPLDSYVVSVALLDAANELAVYVADPVEADIEYGNHFNDLGNFTLDAAGN
jgi:hypothetical protein